MKKQRSHIGGALDFSFANKVRSNSQVELEVGGKVRGRQNFEGESKAIIYVNI